MRGIELNQFISLWQLLKVQSPFKVRMGFNDLLDVVEKEKLIISKNKLNYFIVNNLFSKAFQI